MSISYIISYRFLSSVMRFFARDIDIANPRTVLGDTTSIISSTSSGFMRHHCSALLLLMMPTLQIVRTSLN